MSKTFNAAVRSQFAANMAAVAPQFRPAKVPSAHAWPGEKAFAWTPREGIRCWVCLIASHKGYNEFFVEVGWSARGRYPELDSRPTFAGMQTATRVLDHIELMCRLSSLGDTPGAWKYRPDAIADAPYAEQFMLEAQASLAQLGTEEAELAAKPLVEEAIAALVHFGLPFLERNAAQLVVQPDLPGVP
jgi:hypothetical protein